eukprot:gene15971-biopygen8211
MGSGSSLAFQQHTSVHSQRPVPKLGVVQSRTCLQPAHEHQGVGKCTVRSLTDLAAFPPVLLSAGGGQAARHAARRGVAAGGSVFPWIPPWHAYLARFSRVRAAMRTAPGARKVGPDDTDGLR